MDVISNQNIKPMDRLKSLLLSISLVVLAVLCTNQLTLAQERANEEARVSPNASVSQTIGTTEVIITYGRPAVNNRIIFGDLVPFDQIWRTGANEATTITFSDDVTVEGEKLEAGTYGLFTVPGEDTWTIVFNENPTQWGAFDYNSDEDALRVEVEPEKAPPMEQMMFYFEDVTEESGTIVLHWDDVKVPFTVKA